MNEILNVDNRQNITKMITALTQITETSAREMQTVAENVTQVTQSLNESIMTFNSMLAHNDSSVTNSITGLEQLISESNTTVIGLNKIIDTMNYNLSENDDSYMEMVDRLGVMLRNFEIFSQTIKEQPWQLVRKTAPPERNLPE